MKKGIAFVLAFVLCLGFSGCGEKDGSAKSVYNALAKVGDLSLEAEYKDVVSDFGGKVPISEKIVFRMPNENREIEKERACYIEAYPSADDLGKAVDVLNESMRSSGEKTYGLYSSGNSLLRIDGTVSQDAVPKYADALKKATGEEAVCRNSEELPVEKISINRSFTPPNGVGAREIYDAFKKKFKGLEFYSYLKLRTYDNVSFFEKDEAGKTVIVNINVGYTADDAIKPVGTVDFTIVSGNIYMDFLGDISENRLSEYIKEIEEITGQPIDPEKSKTKK